MLWSNSVIVQNSGTYSRLNLLFTSKTNNAFAKQFRKKSRRFFTGIVHQKSIFLLDTPLNENYTALKSVYNHYQDLKYYCYDRYRFIGSVMQQIFNYLPLFNRL